MKRKIPKFRIKKGDIVIVLSGIYRKKTGKVMAVYSKQARILVEGINKKKHFVKAEKHDDRAGIIEKEAPLHISNVGLLDESSGKSTRIGMKEKNGKLQRYSKRSGSFI